MQRGDVIHRDTVFAQVVVHTAAVLRHDISFGLGKKLLVELALQVLFDEILQAKEDDFVYAFHPRFTWREVGVDQGGAAGVLEFVADFVAVFQ